MILVANSGVGQMEVLIVKEASTYRKKKRRNTVLNTFKIVLLRSLVLPSGVELQVSTEYSVPNFQKLDLRVIDGLCLVVSFISFCNTTY